MRYIMDFLGVLLGYTAKIYYVLKYYLKIFFGNKKYTKSNFEMSTNKQIIKWNNTKVHMSDIRRIVYSRGVKNKYMFIYFKNDKELESYQWNNNNFIDRKLKLDRQKAIELKNIFEKNNHKIFPSMWLFAPIGLVGCTITGGFKKNDFITLAGDNNLICIYQGLDCNPENIPINLVETSSFDFKKDIFTQKISKNKLNRYQSSYQAYVVDKSVTINNKYLFLPWKEGEFLFEEGLECDNLQELNKKIICYFQSKNTTLVESDKNCINRNNP